MPEAKDPPAPAERPLLSRGSAMKFIVLLGIVSLLADITYEGARSSSGPYLQVLGAGAALVALVAGFGEMAGYAVRLLFGFIADRTARYWTLTIVGYAINLLAVPMLALAGNWRVAALLLVLERVGKGIRTPARDAMLAQATDQVGRGWGFGLHEALDQIGAVSGPLILALVLTLRPSEGAASYRFGFAVLLAPALLTLLVLTVARVLFPRPEHFERALPDLHAQGLPREFWVYLVAMAFMAAGFADFPLIAYHFKQTGAMSDAAIPLIYAIAMGIDAVAALALGRLFDRKGFGALIGAVLATALFAPLCFLGGPRLAVVGMVFWAIGMGTQESIVRAAIAGMVPGNRRASAYGVFNMGFGVSWFVGSAFMGLMYKVSLVAVAGFSSAMVLASAVVLLCLHRSRPAAA